MTRRDDRRRVRALRPLGRAALALPDVVAADAVARAWGEAVWTDPLGYRITCVELAMRYPFPHVSAAR